MANLNQLMPVDPHRLEIFFRQEEGPTLEFKQEWYKLEGNSEKAVRQKDELVKDILSLANGSVETVGETSLLVIGVSDNREPDGSRRIFDVGATVPSPIQVLDIVRSAANPPLGYVEILPIEVDGARLFAIAIPSSPHIHETTRDLKTPSQTYSKYAVFIRRASGVDIASEGERQALRTLKKLHFEQIANPPAALFGATVGATIGGIMLARVGSRITKSREAAIAGSIVGPIFGGLLGGLFGQSYQLIRQVQMDFRRVSVAKRRLAIAASVPFAVATWLLADRFSDAIINRLPQTDTDELNQTGT